MENNNELAVLTPTGVEVTAGGEAIVITPIKVKELNAFLAAIQPVLGDLIKKEIDVMALVLKSPEAVIKATAIGCRKSVDWINELGIDELAKLALAMIEVNTDFFVQKVLPAVQTGMQNLTAKLDGQNLTSSSEKQEPVQSST
ncbi:DUF6631 family protein [Nitrosomonas communis]|uniref:Uncharacterized protein n=1 Tax=Nitrosomonas communis TaxID=44574 RepID=A0A1I4SRX2_9PROT|nr:DUF6631 family protein [Nitrosomonas communis]SFM67288.1 hypothetical protein SAMN05421863_104312 [Nitrosomonas communis]